MDVLRLAQPDPEILLHIQKLQSNLTTLRTAKRELEGKLTEIRINELYLIRKRIRRVDMEILRIRSIINSYASVYPTLYSK